MSEIDFWLKVNAIWALVIVVIALLTFIYNTGREKHD